MTPPMGVCIHCGIPTPPENNDTPFSDGCLAGLEAQGLVVARGYDLCTVIDSVWAAANTLCEAAWAGTWECYSTDRVVLLRFAHEEVLLFPDGVATAPREAHAFAAGEHGIAMDHGVSRDVLRFFQAQQNDGFGVGIFRATPATDLIAFVPPAAGARCMKFVMRYDDESDLEISSASVERPRFDPVERILRLRPECWRPAPSKLSMQA